MAGEQRIVWFLLGFAAATGVVLALGPMPAAGQILDPIARSETPRRPAQARSGAAGAAATSNATPLDSEEPNPFYDGRFGPDAASSAQPAPTEAEQADGGSAADDMAAEDDIFGEAQARPRQIPIPQDGDPVSVIEASAPRDGDLSEPNVPPTVGEDITEVDMRSPADVAAFAGAPAAFDPLLLQAEEFNPVFSDSQFRQFGVDPFAPLGTRIGSFILYTAVEADGDYNSNIFASPEPVGDSALEVRPSVRLASNWNWHALELRASGDLSFHDRFSSEDDRAYLAEALGRLDITSHTNIQALVAHEEAQESRSAINASSAGTRPDIVVNRERLALNHRFNRLSVQLRGSVIDTRYGTNIFNGVAQSNADRDFTLYDQAVRPKWEFSPYLFVFSDIALNQRYYQIPAFTDGLIRSSTGERYRVGVSFGEVSEILRGEVSLGYGLQTPNNHELEPIDGLLIDANLSWRVTPLTTLLFTASSEVAETTTADSGGVMDRQYAVEARHNFSTRLVGIAGLGFMTRDFVGAGINENQLTAATGVEYYLSREAVLFSRYQHTVFDSTQPNSSYTVEEVQAGVRLRH